MNLPFPGSRPKALLLGALLFVGACLGQAPALPSLPASRGDPVAPTLRPEPARPIAVHARELVAPQIAHAYRLLLEDKIFEAHSIADGLLRRERHDPDALTLAGVVQIFLLDMDRAKHYLDEAIERAPHSSEVHLRRGDLELALSNFKEAQEEYQRAAALDPHRALAFLNEAASLLQDQKVDAARGVLAKVDHMGPLDREEILTRAMVLFLLGDAAGATSNIDASEKADGPNATTLFIRGMVQLKAGQLGLADELLSKAADLGRENPSLIYQIANLLVALNQVSQAHAVLEHAVATFPHCAKLREQRSEIDKRFRSLGRMKSKRVDPFDVHYDSRLDAAAVDRVIGLFQKAYTSLAERTGLRPRPVVLAIYSTTGFSSPAYYNNLTGEVTISGEFFTQGGHRLDEFVEHAVRHEMTHLFVWHGHQGTTRAIHCLWIDEGLAENVAGGVDYLRHMGVDVPGIFADGPLEMSDLIGNINILWHDNKKNLKAYLQSYFMVTYLMHKGGDGTQGFDRVARLLKMVAQDVSLADALRTVYGMTGAQFDQGWREDLRKSISAEKREKSHDQ